MLSKTAENYGPMWKFQKTSLNAGFLHEKGYLFHVAVSGLGQQLVNAQREHVDFLHLNGHK
jgi:hypothetical protein